MHTKAPGAVIHSQLLGVCLPRDESLSTRDESLDAGTRTRPTHMPQRNNNQIYLKNTICIQLICQKGPDSTGARGQRSVLEACLEHAAVFGNRVPLAFWGRSDQVPSLLRVQDARSPTDRTPTKMIFPNLGLGSTREGDLDDSGSVGSGRARGHNSSQPVSLSVHGTR